MTHSHNHHDQHQRRPSKGMHQDWRTWVVVLLMLGAMAVYIFSMDESLQPEGVQAPVAEDVSGE